MLVRHFFEKIRLVVVVNTCDLQCKLILSLTSAIIASLGHFADLCSLLEDLRIENQASDPSSQNCVGKLFHDFINCALLKCLIY